MFLHLVENQINVTIQLRKEIHNAVFLYSCLRVSQLALIILVLNSSSQMMSSLHSAVQQAETYD